MDNRIHQNYIHPQIQLASPCVLYQPIPYILPISYTIPYCNNTIPDSRYLCISANDELLSR